MEGTKIQWCDDTVNPTMGCCGCELWNPTQGILTCYAGVLHNRHGGKNTGYAPSFEQLTEFPGRMELAAKKPDLQGFKRRQKPWLNGYPRLIFVSDMSDALSKPISFEFLETEIIRNVTSNYGRRHVWLWLTKLPSRMAQFGEWLRKRDIPWPTNLWPGTSITSSKTKGRISQLLKVGDKQTTRFLSIEPQWEELRLKREVGQVHWVIQGGESGSGAHAFDVTWARRMLRDCRAQGTAYFLKQLGENPTNDGTPLPLENRHGGEWGEWPDDLRVRELPAVR